MNSAFRFLAATATIKQRLLNSVKLVTKNGKANLKTEYLFLICIITIALIIRLYELERVPSALFIDEIWATYQPYLIQKGIIALPLYSAIVYFLQGTYFSYSFFGSSILFSRLSAALYGTLLVVIVYFLAKEMFSPKIGLVSAALTAITPWAVIFSRYQIPSMSGVFWFTLAIYLIYKGSRTISSKRILLCGLGSFTLGLSLFSVVTSRIFVLVFLFGFIFLCVHKVRKLTRNNILEWLTYSALFVLASAPIISDIFFPSNVSGQSLAYSTFAHAKNIPELIDLIVTRFALHLSPDFLVLSGGFSYASQAGFQQNIAAAGLFKYSTGTVGMLNYYGLLVYPAILYLFYKVVKKKSGNADKLMLWWAFSSTLATTSAYYDNPNAARAIFGLPALIIIISIFICGAVSVFISFKKKIMRFASILGIILIILLPTTYFLQDYYSNYYSRSAASFDFGYADVANFLTETNNWNRPIFLYTPPSRNWNLAFYSPEQPVNPDKFTVVSSMSDLLAVTEFKNAFIQIQKPLNFVNGTIEYATRIDQSYGGAASSYIQLVFDEKNMLALSIYSQNSTYNRSGYLLSQKANDQVFYEQRALGNAVNHGEWYTVKLVITSKSVLFYFDNDLVTTFSRPTYDTYSYLKFGGESGEVSFADLKIVNGETNEITNVLNDGISQRQIVSGTWEIDENILQGDSSIILIADTSLNLQLLQENMVPFNVLKTIYYPTGDIAFRIILIQK